MKEYIILYTLIFVQFHTSKDFPKFLQFSSKNPDQVAGDTVGGDNGEFLRRNQPTEHLFVPLINNLQAEYNPMFNDIRKYRKEQVREDKGIKFQLKVGEEIDQKLKGMLNK
jgi:hypothetical protein